MQIENHKEEVPFEHYLEKYRMLDPKEAAQRCQVPFDEETLSFAIHLMGYEYHISHPDFDIRVVEPVEGGYYLLLDNIPARTFVMRFLLEGQAIKGSGKYITFREFPTYGELYLQPFTGRCIKRLAYGFGYKLDAFSRACEKIPGCHRISMGDVSYEFELIDHYHMRFIFWEGDEEFPPSAQILYEDNFQFGFHAEDLVVGGDISISTIKGLS